MRVHKGDAAVILEDGRVFWGESFGAELTPKAKSSLLPR